MRQVIRDPEVLERMQMAFELYETAEAMKRQNGRRSHPELSEDEVEQRVLEWLCHRPGVEYGDAEGPSFIRRRHQE